MNNNLKCISIILPVKVSRSGPRNSRSELGVTQGCNSQHTQPSSSVPDGPLHISIRRCLSSTATFCQYVMKSLFHVIGSVPMDVGHLPLLARLSGTLCPRTCGIRRFLRTVTGSLWRHFYLRST